MADNNRCLQSIHEEAQFHQLLSHPRRLKMAFVLRHVACEGRAIFESKSALVREYENFWDEKVGLGLLDFDIRQFLQAGVLEVIPPRKPSVQRRVMLRIEARRLAALPIAVAA
jgi:hypothetical protein